MNNGRESSKFFEHGLIELRGSDFVKRQALLHLCMPNCLFQAVTPTLLGSGLVDGFRIKVPVAAWIPQITDERLDPAYVQKVPHLSYRCNLVMQQRVDEILKTFTDMAAFVRAPGDILPMLPLGTYVECSYRCDLDSVPKILTGVKDSQTVGSWQLQWALAEVFTFALEDLAAWEAAKLRLTGGPLGPDTT